jgi:hypothetical protein
MLSERIDMVLDILREKRETCQVSTAYNQIEQIIPLPPLSRHACNYYIFK